MPDLDLISKLSELPEALENAIAESQSSGVSPLAYCAADASDCSTDGAACTSDCSCDSNCSDCSCNTHCSDCSCNTHCSDCSCNTHCSDCSSDYSDAYAEYVSSSNQAIRIKVYGAAGATISYTASGGGSTVSGSVSAGTASSKSFSITGLSAGTEYTIKIYVAGTLIDTITASTTGSCSDCSDCSDCSSDCSSDGSTTTYSGEFVKINPTTSGASITFSLDQACYWKICIRESIMHTTDLATASGSATKAGDKTQSISGLSSSTTYAALLFAGESLLSLSQVDWEYFTTETPSCSDCSTDCSSDSASTADFSYEYTSSDITVKITGIVSGDVLYIAVRPSDDDSAYVFSTGPYTATGTTYTKSVSNCLSPDTEYAINICVNGTWLGVEYFTTPSAERPSDWEWTPVIVAGNDIALTAANWNAFCDRINEFRTYKGLTEQSFTTAVKGENMDATQVNQARTAILAITGHGTLPSAAVSGEIVTAGFFNELRDALNNIE